MVVEWAGGGGSETPLTEVWISIACKERSSGGSGVVVQRKGGGCRSELYSSGRRVQEKKKSAL